MNDEVIHISECETIKCSNCNKDLLIIKGKDSSKDFHSKIQVDCPYCGDHSYVKEIKGTFLYNPAMGIQLKNYVMKNDIMKFSTSK